MIKARIRWCTCRVENILTLDKLLSLWFCFLLHSILFLTSQTSYRTYKIISSYELARPVMGTIFLVYIIGERAKRVRHSQVCSIENRGYTWFPLRGERAHSLKLFCMYDKRFKISKTKKNGGGHRTTDLTIYPRLKYSPPYKYTT